MSKDEAKTSSRSTSSSDRSLSKRGIRVEEMLNILSQNYSAAHTPLSRRYSHDSDHSQSTSSKKLNDPSLSPKASQRFKQFMEKTQLRKQNSMRA